MSCSSFNKNVIDVKDNANNKRAETVAVDTLSKEHVTAV